MVGKESVLGGFILEKKTYRAWAYMAAVAASFAAMPLGTAQAEEAPAETKPQAVIALPDITSVPIDVVPAPVVTEDLDSTVIDLKMPDNIKQQAEYNDSLNLYFVGSKMGDGYLNAPILMTPDE